MRRILVGSLALVALFTFGAVTPAHADTLDIDYTLTASSDLGLSPGDGCAPWSGTHYFAVQELHVTQAGDYLLDNHLVAVDWSYGALYSQPFDPAQPTDNCLTTVASGPAALAADTTYWLYLSTVPTNALGDYRITIDGPGQIILGPAPDPTSTTLTVAPATITIGDAATLTAVVAGAAPTGDVDFYSGSDLIGTAPIAAGEAFLTYTPTSAGHHVLTATYNGDSSNAPSQSLAVALTVDPAPAPAPELAEAGVDTPIVLAFAAAGLIVVGASLTIHRQHRRAERY